MKIKNDCSMLETELEALGFPVFVMLLVIMVFPSVTLVMLFCIVVVPAPILVPFEENAEII